MAPADEEAPSGTPEAFAESGLLLMAELDVGLGILPIHTSTFLYNGSDGSIRSASFDALALGPAIGIALGGGYRLESGWAFGLWLRSWFVPVAGSGDPGPHFGSYSFDPSTLAGAGLFVRLAPSSWALSVQLDAAFTYFQVGRAKPEELDGPEVAAHPGLGLDAGLSLGWPLGDAEGTHLEPRLRADFAWTQGEDSNRVRWTNLAVIPSVGIAAVFP